MPFSRCFLVFVCAAALCAPTLLAEPTPAAADTGNLIKAGKEAIKKGRFEEAVGLLTQAIAANAQNPEAYTRRATAYAVLTRGDEALKDMAEALRLEPANRNHLLDRARVYEILGRIDEAIQDCTSAITMKSEVTALLLRAQLHAKAGQYPKAIADYTQILVHQPQRSDMYVARGQLYRLTGQGKEAGEDFGKAIRLNPTYSTIVSRLLSQPPTRTTIAKPTLAQVVPAPAPPQTAATQAPVTSQKAPALVAARDTKLVVKKSGAKSKAPAVAAATPPPVVAPEPEPQREPEPPKPDPAALKAAAEAQQVTAALSAGRAQLNAKQWAEAISTYTTVIELRPKHAEAWLRRCMANQLAGNNKAAIDDCGKALELHPDADAFYYRARALHAEKELHRAAADYGNSILMKPYNPDAHFYRAQVWQALDNLSGAIYGYSEAARQKQGFTDAILARAELRLFLGDKTGHEQDLELAKTARK